MKVRKTGGSLVVTLPSSVTEHLRISEGDELFTVMTPTGVELTPYDPDFEAVMGSTRDYMRRHRNALKTLADS